MGADDTSAAVQEALKKHSRLRLAEIRDDHRLAADLGMDSHALLNVVLDVEDRFDIEVDASRLAGIRDLSVAQLVQLVDEHVASPPGVKDGPSGGGG